MPHEDLSPNAQPALQDDVLPVTKAAGALLGNTVLPASGYNKDQLPEMLFDPVDVADEMNDKETNSP